mmetsp:Transcript_16749/g.46030  ORF Transcript_16749/g.46030 Transcript_16749/m.46030 type:complete len:114 (-) Transcript_16749:1732-2073(-)
MKTFEQQLREKRDRKEAFELQAELREERRQAKNLKKERRLENERLRTENEFKHAQKSARQLNMEKLPSKLKAMSKKQLRQIKKTEDEAQSQDWSGRICSSLFQIESFRLFAAE